MVEREDLVVSRSQELEGIGEEITEEIRSHSASPNIDRLSAQLGGLELSVETVEKFIEQAVQNHHQQRLQNGTSENMMFDRKQPARVRLLANSDPLERTFIRAEQATVNLQAELEERGVSELPQEVIEEEVLRAYMDVVKGDSEFATYWNNVRNLSSVNNYGTSRDALLKGEDRFPHVTPLTQLERYLEHLSQKLVEKWHSLREGGAISGWMGASAFKMKSAIDAVASTVSKASQALLYFKSFKISRERPSGYGSEGCILSPRYVMFTRHPALQLTGTGMVNTYASGGLGSFQETCADAADDQAEEGVRWGKRDKGFIHTACSHYLLRPARIIVDIAVNGVGPVMKPYYDFTRNLVAIGAMRESHTNLEHYVITEQGAENVADIVVSSLDTQKAKYAAKKSEKELIDAAEPEELKAARAQAKSMIHQRLIEQGYYQSPYSFDDARYDRILDKEYEGGLVLQAENYTSRYLRRLDHLPTEDDIETAVSAAVEQALAKRNALYEYQQKYNGRDSVVLLGSEKDGVWDGHERLKEDLKRVIDDAIENDKLIICGGLGDTGLSKMAYDYWSQKKQNGSASSRSVFLRVQSPVDGESTGKRSVYNLGREIGEELAPEMVTVSGRSCLFMRTGDVSEVHVFPCGNVEMDVFARGLLGNQLKDHGCVTWCSDKAQKARFHLYNQQYTIGTFGPYQRTLRVFDPIIRLFQNMSDPRVMTADRKDFRKVYIHEPGLNKPKNVLRIDMSDYAA